MKHWLRKRPAGWVALTTGFIPLLFAIFLSFGSEKPAVTIDEESKQCLVCHGSHRYELTDTLTGETVTMKMHSELQIDPVEYSKATHGAFKCTDCHSIDYHIHPHPVSTKFEVNYTCMDCHGGDETYASFNFETIEEEYLKSIHATELGNEFSCWSCHNPHTYRLSDKEPGQLINRVARNNSACLHCHGDINNYAVLIEKELPDLIKSHDWLPNQSLHFRKVRCIDCHASNNDSIMVAHLVLPASESVKNCVECHSTNSILMGSLYKHQAAEKRNKLGFYNGLIMNEAYVIGANRNYYLNIASVVIFIMVLIGIAIHATLRYIHRHRKHGN
ncbi:cytochrome c554 [Lentimicrobium saccharophilum]|uniref:Cytochrome c554 n=1 Tax=Lentimicrobium saccharophilum TaxID=1678841 RepID=A0A0S7BQL7_9BACT|nr:cytochrome c3 family protein [Lentimicrobium saccharophilum]GAP42922.1 cytochrome c554 [Lentimicrobium saccharophilum]